MVKGIRIVAPFKWFPPEGGTHQLLEREGFDWPAAMAMMIDTAKQHNHDCPVHIITDTETTLPVPTLHYSTSSNRLMVWSIEVCLAFLRSPEFDRHTVMLDIDQLIFGDLSKWFTKRPQVDLGVLVRPHGKHIQPGGEPLLNGVQFWHRNGRKRLVSFYERCLEVVQQLPEYRIAWGGDTDALRAMIEPIKIGIHERAGASVQMWPAEDVLESWSSMHTSLLAGGTVPPVGRGVLDFRALRKRHMSAMYQATRAVSV